MKITITVGQNRCSQGQNRDSQGQNRDNEGHNRDNQGQNRENQGQNRDRGIIGQTPKIVRDLESLGEKMERSGLIFENFY